MPFQPPTFVDIGAVDFTAASEPAISREVLLRYLQNTAEDCRHLLKSADNGLLFQKVEINGGSYALIDQVLGQVRHLMSHVGCVSSIFRCETGNPLVWIGYDKKQAE
jgi:hypothetical protein